MSNTTEYINNLLEDLGMQKTNTKNNTVWQIYC